MHTNLAGCFNVLDDALHHPFSHWTSVLNPAKHCNQIKLMCLHFNFNCCGVGHGQLQLAIVQLKIQILNAPAFDFVTAKRAHFLTPKFKFLCKNFFLAKELFATPDHARNTIWSFHNFATPKQMNSNCFKFLLEKCLVTRLVWLVPQLSSSDWQPLNQWPDRF